jgi:hypothetical protein
MESLIELENVLILESANQKENTQERSILKFTVL